MYTHILLGKKKHLLILPRVAVVMHSKAFCEENEHLSIKVSAEMSYFNLLSKPTSFLAYSIMEEDKDVDGLAIHVPIRVQGV